jgi:hypothetical protein
MMLETEQPNSRITIYSFFIKLSEETKFMLFSQFLANGNGKT